MIRLRSASRRCLLSCLRSWPLDLDVQHGRFLRPRVLQRRFLCDRLGMVDRLEIVADGFWRRLGGLVDEELNSCLCHFDRYGINDHGSTLLTQTCQAAIYVL